MSPRPTDPWGDYRRDRDDISIAAAFFMTFALLGLVAWVVFFGTGWMVPAALDVLPNRATHTPAGYTASITTTTGVAFPLTGGATTATTAAPASSPTPKATAGKMRVANTGGDGVYLRRSPNDTDLWVPWPENTIVDSLNEQQQNNGQTYLKVRDPRGNVGWMPSRYLVPA